MPLASPLKMNIHSLNGLRNYYISDIIESIQDYLRNQFASGRDVEACDCSIIYLLLAVKPHKLIGIMQLKLLVRIIKLTAVFLLVACLQLSASDIGKLPLPTVTTASAPINISGTIVNTENEPLEGISVTVKGTKVATSTNSKGEFFLANVAEDAILVFTGTNIETFETKLAGRNQLKLTASLKVGQLADVAVVANGLQRTEKRKLIGAVSTVRGEQLKDIPTNGSFEKSISGRVAGVYVRSNSGRPGESATVQIRGINTLSGNREPLWVLDGMPLPTGEVSSSVNELLTRGLGNIPPEDIESISILKDATASAIYGARAANGVVVITTKQGKAGKNYLSYSSRFSVSEKPKNQFSFMNTEEKIAFERSLFSEFKDPYGGRVVKMLNSVEKGTITAGEAENRISDLSGTNTNWMDELMQNATSQSHVLSLSGGNEKTQYYASLNYMRANGVLKTNKYENAGFNMKLSNYFRKNLLLRFNLYSTVKKNREGQSAVDPFTYAVFAIQARPTVTK